MTRYALLSHEVSKKLNRVLQVEYITKLNQRYDEKKYNTLANRIFDKTGRRIDPKVLKMKLSS